MYHIGQKGPSPYYSPFLYYILIPIKTNESKSVQYFINGCQFLIWTQETISKYFEVKIWKHRSLHLVYRKLDTKFEQLWYHKNKLKVRLKLTRSIWCSNIFHIKILIYYDYNMHNLIIHNYLLRPYWLEFFFKSIFHLHVTHFVRSNILCK